MNLTNVPVNYLTNSFEINIKRILKFISNMNTAVDKKEMFYITLGTVIYKALQIRIDIFSNENLLLYQKIHELKSYIPYERMYVINNIKLNDSQFYISDNYIEELERLRSLKYELNDEIDLLINLYKENKRLKEYILLLGNGIKKYYSTYPFRLEDTYKLPLVGYKIIS